ncbi:MAG: hypothetical protein K2X55_22785 [Burkholderiaceae bacterium]|nr:hypothetical protein [Burkholderiaceae bacterium]
MSKDAFILLLFTLIGTALCGFSAAQLDYGMSMLFAVPMIGAGVLAYKASKDLFLQVLYDCLPGE